MNAIPSTSTWTTEEPIWPTTSWSSWIALSSHGIKANLGRDRICVGYTDGLLKGFALSSWYRWSSSSLVSLDTLATVVAHMFSSQLTQSPFSRLSPDFDGDKGLAIDGILKRNVALSGKWLWKIPPERNSLRAAIIRTKFRLGRDSWNSLQLLQSIHRSPLKGISNLIPLSSLY